MELERWHITNKRISAIFSDYDGTLCPAANLSSDSGTFIPRALAEILWAVSEQIPICIISSKDSHFLINRVPFAKAFSCIMGIETLTVKRRDGISSDIRRNKLSIGKPRLIENGRILETIAQQIEAKFSFVKIERKRTYDEMLAGITINWRARPDWEEPRKAVTSYMFKLLQRYGEPATSLRPMTYSSHPFVDIYATKCDKRVGYSHVKSAIGLKDDDLIMYLGDSENDNPAFKKAGISIGIKSDPRLLPRLECQFILEYDKLAPFMQSLLQSNFTISPDSMKMLKLRANMGLTG